MDKKLIVFAFLVGLFIFSLFVDSKMAYHSVQKGDFSIPMDGNAVDVYFFYGQGCSHCERVAPFLTEMENKYPIELHKYEIYNNRSCIPLFDEYCSKYGILQADRGVPTIFVADSYLVGDIPILDSFEEKVKIALQDVSSTYQVLNLENAEKPDQLIPAGNRFSILTITVAALLDSISPCSIAILVFLIGARILVSNRKKRALTIGLSFCLSVFIAYFLFGIGLFAFVQVSGFSQVFSLLTGLIAVLAGFFYLKDAFWSDRGGFKMEVPRSLKPVLMKMLKGVASPLGAFLMGFLVCLFELPCTGGPYLFILGQLANTATRLQAIPLLLYYNFIFILPLILISLILYSNPFSIGKVREWNDKNKRLLRLVGGLVMIGLGFFGIPVSQIFNKMTLFLSFYKIVAPCLLLVTLFYFVISSVKRVKLRSKLGKILGCSLLLLSIIVVPLFVRVGPTRDFKNIEFPKEGIGMANPAAVYCLDLGYEYKMTDSDQGQYGVCVFPDGAECDAWHFLEGKCGKEYSYCAQHGYNLTMKTDGSNPLSREYAVCVNGDEKAGSSILFSSLSEEAAKGAISLEESSYTQEDSVSTTSLPSAFDWRNKNGKNWMTLVKNQGICGSCWAHSATGVIEAVYNIRANIPDLDLDLSEQMLTSNCFKGSHHRGTCCGGWPDKVFEYVRDYGIVDEECFPYADRSCNCGTSCDSINCAYNTDGNCSNSVCSDKCPDWENRLYFITDYGYVTPTSIKGDLIENGPLSAVIGMGGKYGGHWDGDVYRCDRDSGINHAIVIVGYDDTEGYWIAKNSWGANWNGDGYFKIGYGECRVEDFVYYVYHEINCEGDITGPEGKPDGQVDMRDVGFVARALGSNPEHLRWNPIADIIKDDYIDMKDLVAIARFIGKDCIRARV